MSAKKRIIVAVTGASGSVLAVDLLRELRRTGRWETHVAASTGALLTLKHELPGREECFRDLADRYHDIDDVGAPVASGSFPCAGMIVVPCSMKTLAGIHSGYSDNLILRAADVTLKERRPLVLAVRETPLSPVHLRNMSELSAMGAIIMPPMMAFYNLPQSVDDLVRHCTGKIMSVFGEEAEGYKRWGV